LKLDDKLKAKIKFEISQIDKLLDESKPLLDLCKLKTPDFIEMSAAALLLHSFYNGIENMLILIFKYYNEELPNGNKWHMKLLDRSFIAYGNRKQVFKIELQKILEEYLKFRHFIRHAYGFQLEWTRMEYLIDNIGTIWDKIKGDINYFILSTTGFKS
jgi:hypothetical protein